MINPAELAQPFAQKEMLAGKHEPSDMPWFEVDEYEDLQEFAKVFRFIDRPFEVRTMRALLLPEDEGKSPFQFNELNFIGEFTAYSAVSAPSYLGRSAINGLCLTFENITLLPHRDQPERVRLHVPAFAVESIEGIAA